MRRGTVNVIVEIPKGSRNKYEMDKATGRIRLDRLLFSSVHYPADYGYIDGTLGGDGDPLDALVLVGEPTFPGCLIEARPIGVFHMADDKGDDEKVLTVPVASPFRTEVGSIADIDPHLLREIEHFFTVYKDLENKKVDIKGWEDVDSAWQLIDEAMERGTH